MMKLSNILWSSQEAKRATNGEIHLAWDVSGVSINTRTLQSGDLFIALEGPNVDGHDFVADAFEKGASAAAVHHRPPVLDPDAPLLVVNDTMQALEDLGRFARERAQDAKFIAVTGSVGKTGTKEALKMVLSQQGKTSASEGSLNNHWGVPLSLARIPADSSYAVLEMGMNHAGELTPLSKMVRPHVCVVTTIAPAHTEFFNGTEDIARAKAEIFEGAEPGALAVLNVDIPEFPILAEAAKNMDIVTFGENAKSDFSLKSYTLHNDATDVIAKTPLGDLQFRVGVPGKHWAINALCVLSAVYAAGGDVEQAASDLAALTPPSGRGDRYTINVDGGSAVVFNESYNASPASVKASMAVLGHQPGRSIAVLGDMLEMGEDSPKLHADIAKVLDDNAIDKVFLAGHDMRYLWEVLPDNRKGKWAASSDELVDAVCQSIQPGDVIMVKGSAGVRMSRIVDALKSLGTQKGEG